MPEKKEEKMSAEEFLNFALAEAIASHASDIHIEPHLADVAVRFRIDGVLFEKWRKPLYEFDAIINRIKVLATLDITTHGIPQDGHFEVVLDTAALLGHAGRTGVAGASSPAVEAKPLGQHKGEKGGLSDRLTHLLFAEPARAEGDSAGSLEPQPSESKADIQPSRRSLSVRVSIFPTVAGDAIVLRMLNREDMLRTLDQLGMDNDTLARFKKLISKDYGMVLVTGPVSSGKTTTLYSLLQALKTREKNIVTIEDPVELYFDDMRQSQASPEHGLTFASGMRSILRQDPDIIMIGEIRDPETAEYAVRASLTGRLIFSTIHSNTTVGTIPRLVEMNIERSLIAYALNGIVAQRLVRKICPSCRITYTPHQEFLTYFKLDDTYHFVKGSGCDACLQTGFQGRTGLFEVLYFDDTVQTMIIDKAPMKDIEEYVQKTGMKTLKQDAVEKALAGITTLEEAGKVV